MRAAKLCLLALAIGAFGCDGGSPAPTLVPDAATARDSAARDSTSVPDVYEVVPPQQQTGPLFVPTDGARLKARWLEGPEGVRSFVGWHDTTLGTPCRFQNAADGQLRCLPLGFSLGITPTDAADTDCKAPAIINLWEGCQEPSPYVVQARSQAGECLSRQHIFRLGPRLTNNVTYRIVGVDACVPEVLPERSTAYRLGAEMPPAMFVKANLITEPVPRPADAVQLQVLQAEDGAAEDWDVIDRARGVPCYYARMASGQIRCLALGGSTSSFAFAESSCMRPALFVSELCPGRAMFTGRVIAGSCPIRYEVVAHGARLQSVFLSGNGMCTSFEPVPTSSYYEPGPLIPEEQFPPLEQVPVSSPHRLQRRMVITPGGQQRGSGWFDAERGEACIPTFIGGKYRCLPGNASVGAFHADDRCTSPLLRTQRETCSTANFALTPDLSSCPVRRRLLAKGPVHGGPVYQRTLERTHLAASLTCKPYTPEETEVFFSLTPVAEDSLPELQAIEP